MSKKPTVLMILDGYGMSDKIEGNAIAQAKTHGKFGSRTYQYGCRTYRIPDVS